MVSLKRACSVLVLSLLSLSLVRESARAQDGEEFSLDESEEGAEAKPAEPEPALEPEAKLLSDEQALEEEKSPDETYRKSSDPFEDPDKSYFFAGAAWRYVRLPSWTLEWFLEAAPSVGTAGSFFGEFGYRKDGFQITGLVGYMGWSFKGPFQLSGDPEVDTEWLDADFNLLMGTATFTWSTAFTDWFALEYGIEAGIGALIGKMTRSEASKDRNGKWSKCPGWAGGPDLPNPTIEQQAFCDRPIGKSGETLPDSVRTNGDDELGAHYGVTAEKVPPVVPVLGPRLSLRFKPIAQLVLRVDVPLPILPFGFVGGLAAHYGF